MKEQKFIFKRVEKKYLINDEQYEKLYKLLLNHMALDRFGKQTIANIYYDTADDLLIRQSLEKPSYKEKLRIRCYGNIDEYGTSYVEIKKKFKGVVYKRRITLPLREAEGFLNESIVNGAMDQIKKEVAYMRNLYKTMPKMFIAYDREALYDLAETELRVTFDTNIRFRQDSLHLNSPHVGESLLPKGRTLMEIKIPGAMPLWLSEILSKLQIFPSSFSKYGEAYKITLKRKGELQTHVA